MVDSQGKHTMLRQKLFILLIGVLTVFYVGSCATLPKDFKRPVSYAYTDTNDTTFGKSRSDEIRAHPGQSGFYLLENGLDAFVARGLLVSGAERSIDAQYYLFHNDHMGSLFADQLIKAADRGVRVRLLVDDMGLKGRDLGVAVMDTHPNIEIRIFNPFSRNTLRYPQFITRFGSVTRRMHIKSLTVDNQVAILGGRNIGNEYFDADPNLRFLDLDVLAIGKVVKEVSVSFDRYWNSELAYPVSVLIKKPPTFEEIEQKFQWLNEFVKQQTDSAYIQSLRNSNLANKVRRNQVEYRWGEAEVIYDQPEKILHDVGKTEYHLAPKIAPHFRGVQEELIVFSPYFIPGKSGMAFLTQLIKRGVRVRILTNSTASNDLPFVHAAYSKYRKGLLRAGVELYEMDKKLTSSQRIDNKGGVDSTKTSLHAKSFVFDRKKVFIGSLNLDPRAIRNNTEIGVIFSSVEIGNEMGEWFDQNIEQVAFRLELKKGADGTERIFWHGFDNNKPVVFSVDPHTSLWRRFANSLMGLFAIESLL
jgi:putative cardiolipin synthase